MTEEELDEKADRFLQTLERGAQAMTNGRTQNSQTGHKIEIEATRERGDYTYRYRLDGTPCLREDVHGLLRGDWLGKVGSS